MSSHHSDKADADVKRISKLMKGLAERCYAEAEGNRGSRISVSISIGVVAIVSWEDDDDDSFEDTAAVFESKRHHVQTGMMVDLLTSRMNVRRHPNDS